MARPYYVFIWILIAPAGCPFVSANHVAAGRYGIHRHVADAQTDAVPESSGVVAGRVTPDIYWTHNDSGAYRPRVYAFRLNEADRRAGMAKDMGYVQLNGARINDWEDIAADDAGRLYILDGGDNPPCTRGDKRIYRFAEPAIDPQGGAIRAHVDCRSLRFEYPDPADPKKAATRPRDRYDSECLLVCPKSHDLYLVTKRSHDEKQIARLYKLPAEQIEWDGQRVHVLQFVTDLTKVLGVKNNFLDSVTGGDCGRDGRRVVLRSYVAAYEFIMTGDGAFESIFAQKPRRIGLFGELQGEGICYAADGYDLITTSEVMRFGGRHFKVYMTPWQAPDPAADFDRDGDVDFADYVHFLECYTGRNEPQDMEKCLDVRLDDDGDVDLDDFYLFHEQMDADAQGAAYSE